MDALCHYSGEVSVDVVYYDPCLDVVVVVGFSMDERMSGQVMQLGARARKCRHRLSARPLLDRLAFAGLASPLTSSDWKLVTG